MKLPIVVVQWHDANGETGWEDDSQSAKDPAVVFTVGFIVGRTKAAITVASTSDRQGVNNLRMTIPRGMIVSITRLPFDTKVAENARKKTNRPAAA